MVVIASNGAERTVRLDDFFTGFRSTVLQPGELITAIEFPTLGDSESGIWAKLGNRAAQAISVVHLGIVVDRADDGVVRDARIAIGSVAARAEVLHDGSGAHRSSARRHVDRCVRRDRNRSGDTARRCPRDRRLPLCTHPDPVRRSLDAIRSGATDHQWPGRPCLVGDMPPGTSERRAVDDNSEIQVMLNGALASGRNAASATLLDWLRDEAGLTGTKEGAPRASGACTVQLNGDAVMACLVPAAQVDGHSVATVESMADPDGTPHAIQQAFVDEFAVQCGFCIPGFIVAGAALLDELHDPTLDDIRLGLSGNLCRCTGYYPIMQAVQRASVVDVELAP